MVGTRSGIRLWNPVFPDSLERRQIRDRRNEALQVLRPWNESFEMIVVEDAADSPFI